MTELLATREAALLFIGVLLVVSGAFVTGRVLRALHHGFSIRLQLFFAILGTSLLATGVIGFWAVERMRERAAALALEFGAPTEAVVALLHDFGPKVTLIFTLLGLAAAGAAFALGRGVAEPLERLARSAESIARGERHTALPHPVGREVRRLTAAFESMRRELEDRHAMEGFVADLSHELKNPVSAVRAATEVLMDGAAEDPAARDRFLGRIDEATRRLEGLLEDLLGLARLEARGVATREPGVDLHAVLRDSAEAHRAAAEDRDLRLEVRAAPCRLPGDPRWLRRLVDNLVSNALRYGPPGSAVRLTLELEGHEAVLRVRDRGVGVAPALRQRLFERFVTDRREAGQSGLGLAIVRSVAEHHGGSARLVDAEGPGACFEVRLPGARAPTTRPPSPAVPEPPQRRRPS